VTRTSLFAQVLALAASVTATAAGDGAKADEAKRVALQIQACPSIAEAEVRRVVGIEIGDLLVPEGGGAPANADADRMTIECDGDLARIEATGTSHARPLSRALRLSDFPGDAAPRALALAAIEVLAALSPALRQRIEVHEGKPPAASPKPTAAEPAPASLAEEPQREDAPPSWRIGAVGSYLWFPHLGVSAAGGGIDIDRQLGGTWMLGCDLNAAVESKDVPLGRARALLGSFGAFAGLSGPSRVMTVALGARLGLAQMRGDPLGAADVTGEHAVRPWAGPLIAARGRLDWRHLSVEMSAEAGVALFGARGLAGGAPALGAEGPWVAISFGPGLRFAR
jgi:hypothetical protein